MKRLLHALLTKRRVTRRLRNAGFSAVPSEQLEPRRLLFDINGTSGVDVIEVAVVDNFVYVSVNGSFPVPTPVFDDIAINAGAGNDEIRIFSSENELIDVFPGTGSDDIFVCDDFFLEPFFGSFNFRRDLDQLSARVYVHAGTDSIEDYLYIRDSDDTGNDTYNIFESASTPMRLQKPEPGFESEEVWWGEANMIVSLLCNNGDNAVNIQSSVFYGGANEQLNISGIGGADTYTIEGVLSNFNRFNIFGGADDVTLILGDVFDGNGTIDIGGEGLISFSDPAAVSTYRFTTALINTVQHNILQQTEAGGITGTVQFEAGARFGLVSSHASQASNFNLERILLNTRLDISAGAGNDSFSVNTDDFENGVFVTLSGGSGTDPLTLDDTSQPSNVHYGFESGQFTKRIPNGIAYFGLRTSTIESALMTLSTRSDVINSDGNYGSFSNVTINGNAGDDIFNVAPSLNTTATFNGNAHTTGDRVNALKGDALNGGTFLASGTDGGSYFYTGFLQYNIDTMETFSVNPAAPSAPLLNDADDTGRSNTDNITNRTTLAFLGTGASNGDKVTLRRDLTPIGSGISSDTGWVVVGTFPTGDATFNVSARVEGATSGLLSSFSAATAVQVDTIAPTNAPAAAPDLRSISDSGQSSTDNITNDNTPTLDGSGAAASARVRLRVGGAVTSAFADANASGVYFLTSAVIADGARTITASHEDVAGNIGSTVSPALNVTIDTVAPGAPSTPDLLAASDSGQSSTDNITNDATPTFALAGPELIELSVDSVLVTNYAAPSNVNLSTLADGNHTIVARSIDVAGNTSTAAPTVTFTIDTVAPAAASSPDLQAASDSGLSSTDNLTNDSTPTFTVTSPALVWLISNGVTLLNYVAPGSITAPALNDTVHVITARAIDVAGNVATTTAPTLSITVDTVAPTAPTTIDLVASSDSGFSNTDNITNDFTPTFAVNSPERVQLRVFGGAIVANYALPASVTSSELGDGANQITAFSIDVAGNSSSGSVQMTVTIDTFAPGTPSSAPNLLAGSDSGVSSTDNITNDNTPDVSAFFIGDRYRLLNGTTVVADYMSTTPFTFPALSDGLHNITARGIDLAGNVSAGASPILALTIDTAAPSFVSPPVFQFETLQSGVPHVLNYPFTEDVGPALAASDFVTTNLTTSSNIAASLNYVGARTAIITFPSQNALGITGHLPDGNYRTTIAANAVTDIAGNSLPASTLDFFVFSGDANRDRVVNISDFSILAARFNVSGTFSQADFNYGGFIEINDFAILASKFNNTLPAPSDLPATQNRTQSNRAPLVSKGSASVGPRSLTLQAISRIAPSWSDRPVTGLLEQSAILA